MLPIRLNKIAYPICQRLHAAKIIDRVVEGQGRCDVLEEEMADLIELAFVAAQAANPRVTREEFDNWPISPPELIDAFFLVRYQTGAWLPVEGSPDDQIQPVEEDESSGEAQRAETLPT
jgi:hypothetical protein